MSDTKSLSKELSRLAPTHNILSEYRDLQNEITSISEMKTEAESISDDEIIKECLEEMENLNSKLSRTESSLIESLLPKDDEDYSSDALIEIRPGTGGDEASLFAMSLMQCYTKFSQNRNWKVEKLQFSKTDIGGLREAVLSVASSSSPHNKYAADPGELSPYGALKYESGVHRVQRVPVNDVRIHTSTASVAVLRHDASSSDGGGVNEIPAAELKVETMRSSGAGGQHVNTTESAVRLTHIPTGISVSIQDERSQHQNRTKAMRLIHARVSEVQREEERRKRGEERNELMGGGERSERVRTYNFPQDRVSDHRSKAVEFGIDKLLDGGDLVAVFGEGLRQMRRESLLKELEKQYN